MLLETFTKLVLVHRNLLDHISYQALQEGVYSCIWDRIHYYKSRCKHRDQQAEPF